MPETVFKKEILLKTPKLNPKASEMRSESDAHLAASLGINLVPKETVVKKINERLFAHKEIEKKEKTKRFFAGSEKLEHFLLDFHQVPEEHRVRFIAVWDFETTDKFHSHAVSLAIKLYDLEEEMVVEEFYKVMNPLDTISDGAYQVHKISQYEAEKEPSFEEHLEEIEALFDKADMFCGQNLKFDLDVLDREYNRLDRVNKYSSIPVFDTMTMGKGIVPVYDKKGKVKAPTLTELCLHYELVESAEDAVFHNAEVDVEMTAKVMQELLYEEF